MTDCSDFDYIRMDISEQHANTKDSPSQTVTCYLSAAIHVVVVEVVHYVAYHYVFHCFAGDTGERDWSVVGGRVLWAFLEYRDDICLLPVLRYRLGVD